MANNFGERKQDVSAKLLTRTADRAISAVLRLVIMPETEPHENS